ncbi:hypothetical protein MTO96_002654 [Rhipicephalus appendiculatus]
MAVCPLSFLGRTAHEAASGNRAVQAKRTQSAPAAMAPATLPRHVRPADQGAASPSLARSATVITRTLERRERSLSDILNCSPEARIARGVCMYCATFKDVKKNVISLKLNT